MPATAAYNFKLSQPVIYAYRPGFSINAPTLASTCRCCIVTVSPATLISPTSGAVTPVITFIVVDLPAPFGPTSPMIVPRATENDTSRKARTRPNDLLIFESCKIGVSIMHLLLSATINHTTQLDPLQRNCHIPVKYVI